MADKISNSTKVIKIGSSSGHTIINKNSPLQRLHYFDGKFLRAPDLVLEQQALLNQVRLSNQAGGAGVVHGFDCTEGNNDDLQISSGFAIDFAGRVLLLNNGIEVDIAELIEKSRNLSALTLTPAPAFSGKASGFEDCQIKNKDNEVSSSESDKFYLISIHHSEAYCGEEDVYGKLCSEACSTSTDRSYIIEGIEVRAIPINISGLKNSSAVTLTQEHLRSRVAAAYFAQEQAGISSHISAPGLASSMWCQGSEAQEGNGVPIAVLGRNANIPLFLDPWTVRRERMEAPPRHYWAGRMAMRSWQIYLAQILQFQCHLRKCLGAIDLEDPGDQGPCADTRKVAKDAAIGMRYLIDSLSKSAEKIAAFTDADKGFRALTDFDGGFTRLEAQYQQLIDVSRVTVPNRLMINCGIVEVPSAGYLPVSISSTISVNEQVQRLFGEGVDLRFCVVRPDFVAHALEEAQHMQRICLLSGLDDPAKKPQVDVLVPDGEIEQVTAEITGSGYQADITIYSEAFKLGWPQKNSKVDSKSAATANSARSVNAVRSSGTSFAMAGAARGEQLEADGYGFYMAAKSGDRVAVSKAIFSELRKASPSALRALSDQPENLASINAAVGATSDFKVSTLVPTSSLWVDLKTDRDPFNLNRGDITDVRAKITLVSTRKVNNINTVLVEKRSINGQLHIQKSAAQRTDTKFTARLIADGVWEEIRSAGANSDNRSEVVKLDETVLVSRAGLAGLPPSIAIAIVNPSFFAGLDNIQLVFERVWSSPTKSRVRMLLRYQRPAQDFASNAFIREVEAADTLIRESAARTFAGNQEVQLAEGYLQEDQSVLQPGNAFHSASLSALDNISKALKNSGFADQAGKLLFPPPQQVPTDLRILAKASWVLFHRRRDKICAAARAEEVLLKPRRYRVYHIHLQNRIDIEELNKILATNSSDIIAKFNPTPVTIIEFSPGLGTILTTHADVRADWEAAVQVDADVHVGLIASEGDVINEGEALADVRLQSLTNLLAPVSEIADDLGLLSINEVPPTLAAGEVDGVIIYFTKAVETVCHTVYRLVADINVADVFFKDFLVYIRQSTGQTLGSFLQVFGAQALSVQPRFVEESDDFFGANEANKLAASWDILGDGPVARVLSLSANEIDEQQLVTRQQSRKITQTVGSVIELDSVSYHQASAKIFNVCSKASILIAETECNDVYFVSMPRQQENELLKLLVGAIKKGGITAAILNSANSNTTTATSRQTSAFNRFRAVNFYRDSAQFESRSQEQFLLNWKSELQATPPASINGFYIVVARAGGSTAETAANLALAEKQGLQLQELMGINSSQVVAVTNNPEVPFPVACRTFTLLVIPSVNTPRFTTATEIQARHATSRNSGTPVALIRSPTQRMGDALNALRP